MRELFLAQSALGGGLTPATRLGRRLTPSLLESLALATSPNFPWACPTCFKKGVTAIQRAVLKPTGQGAAGAKRKRRK